jgi:hypothetical protein
MEVKNPKKFEFIFSLVLLQSAWKYVRKNTLDFPPITRFVCIYVDC